MFWWIKELWDSMVDRISYAVYRTFQRDRQMDNLMRSIIERDPLRVALFSNNFANINKSFKFYDDMGRLSHHTFLSLAYTLFKHTSMENDSIVEILLLAGADPEMNGIKPTRKGRKMLEQQKKYIRQTK